MTAVAAGSTITGSILNGVLVVDDASGWPDANAGEFDVKIGSEVLQVIGSDAALSYRVYRGRLDTAARIDIAEGEAVTVFTVAA